MSGFDIIADIHGHGDQLRTLLDELGYRRSPGGPWGHPDRKAIFVGDLCDRGPDQLEVISIVRSMVDGGNAEIISGNHEANARAFATWRRDGRSHLRKRTDANRHQHEAFLAAVGEDSELHKEIIGWFADMPLWIEKDGFRVVHACWDPRAMEVLTPYLSQTRALNEDGLHIAYTRNTAEFSALETVLKGLEVPLPLGSSFFDKEGFERRRARTRWWDAGATTYRAAAIVPEEVAQGLPDAAIPSELVLDHQSDRPVFCGHYWLSGEPYLTSDRVACLDFSVAKGGVLCAYRWDGELSLTANKLHWAGRQPAPAIWQR